MPLVQRLTGDPSSKCREAVGVSLKALMHRVAPDPLDKLAQCCLIWLGGGDARLARTAAQVSACYRISSPLMVTMSKAHTNLTMQCNSVAQAHLLDCFVRDVMFQTACAGVDCCWVGLLRHELDSGNTLLTLLEQPASIF